MRAGSLILIVDDSVDIRDTLEFLLRSEGFLARGAKDGTTALSLLNDDAAVDLIFLDLSLPDMRGEELIQKIRESRCGCHSEIILFSAGSNVQKLAESNQTKFISKPFKFADVLKLVRELPNPVHTH